MYLKAYMQHLTAIHDTIYSQEQNRGPREETEAPCHVVHGEQVYLRVFRRNYNENRREGCFKVVRATPTVVQVEGSSTWYHLNHCTRVPRLRARRQEDQVVEGWLTPQKKARKMQEMEGEDKCGLQQVRVMGVSKGMHSSSTP